MNPYGTLAREGYGEPQVLNELGRSGGYLPSHMMGDGYRMPPSSGFAPGMMGGNPFGSGMMGPPTSGMMGPGFGNPYVEDFGMKMPGSIGRMPPRVFDPMPFIPGEAVVGERIDEPRFVGVGPAGMQFTHAVKPYVTMDKYVEVPQTIIKEGVRHVPKPEIVERIIEVPRMSYNERTVPAARKVVDKEEIVEVHRKDIIEYRPPQHIPKTEIQERLIEIPKIEYREIIEYEDRIEYREVPVDKIVEVPQIEYVQREVERFVPQTYVREYDVPRYTEVPVQQIQEVERIENVPVINPIPRYHSMPVPVNVPVQTPSITMGGPMAGGMMGSGMMGSRPFGSMSGMNTMNAYANYDPMSAIGMGATMPLSGGSFRGPPGMSGSFRGPPGMMGSGMMGPGMMGGMPPMPMSGMMNSMPGMPPAMMGMGSMPGMPMSGRPIPAF